MNRSVRAVVQLVLAASLAASLAGCAGVASLSVGGAGETPHTTLTVFGAASLRAALVDLDRAYTSANPTVAVTVSTDSSAALETQIEQGAPADVFLSADTANPQKLVAAGMAAGGVVKFAGNLLTIIVPAANPGQIQSPADLVRSGVKIVAAGPAVPITKYANQLVANLAKQPGYPSDFAARYAANVVSHEDNVAAVVAKVDLGEADAGIVYTTDARTSTNVATVSVPADANVPATYGGVVVKGSTHVTAAQAYLAWVAGAEGQAILHRFGFLSPS